MPGLPFGGACSCCRSGQIYVMLWQYDFEKDVPNIDIVFSSCQVLIGFTVTFVLGRGIRFRVVICKRCCQSNLGACLLRKLGAVYAYPSQLCLQTQRTSSRVLTLLAPWFLLCETFVGGVWEISATQKCTLKLLNFLVGPIRHFGVPVRLAG